MKTDQGFRRSLSRRRHSLFAHLRCFRGNHRWRRNRTAFQPAKILLRQFHCHRGIEIAHQRRRQVVRGIVSPEISVRFFPADGVDIGRPTHHRPSVWRRLPEQRIELFRIPSGRCTVGAHPAFFHHHVALGVKLPEHRIQQPVGFHPEPQFQSVRGQIDKVDRVIFTRSGIHAGGALTCIQPVEFILDNQLRLALGHNFKLP